MADTGYKNPGTTSTAALAGSSKTWSNTDFVKVLDSFYAQASASSGYTNYITATNFSFTSIPDGARILGIQVEVMQLGGAADIQYDKSVRLINASSVIVGTDKATATYFPYPTEAYQYYGGATDLWGLTPTSADVKSSNWGVAYAAQGTACFVKGTLVSTPYGDVPIELLKVGDIILANDLSLTRVKSIFSRTVPSVICLNEKVTASPKHPFLTNNGFVELGQLSEGGHVLSGLKLAKEKIRSLRTIHRKTTVYNLSVEEPNTYFANGYAVHNKPNPERINHIAMKIYYQPIGLRITSNQIKFTIL